MIISSIGILFFSFPIPFTGSWYGFTILHMVLHGFVQIGYLTACVYVFEMVGPSKRYLAIITSIVFSLGYGSVSLWGLCFASSKSLTISSIWSCEHNTKVLAFTKMVEYDSLYLCNIIIVHIFLLFARISTGMSKQFIYSQSTKFLEPNSFCGQLVAWSKHK